jgi:hypothetical protein
MPTGHFSFRELYRQQAEHGGAWFLPEMLCRRAQGLLATPVGQPGTYSLWLITALSGVDFQRRPLPEQAGSTDAWLGSLHHQATQEGTRSCHRVLRRLRSCDGVVSVNTWEHEHAVDDLGLLGPGSRLRSTYRVDRGRLAPVRIADEQELTWSDRAVRIRADTDVWCLGPASAPPAVASSLWFSLGRLVASGQAEQLDWRGDIVDDAVVLRAGQRVRFLARIDTPLGPLCGYVRSGPGVMPQYLWYTPQGRLVVLRDGVSFLVLDAQVTT